MDGFYSRTAERDRALGLVQVAILRVIDRNPKRAYGAGISEEVSRGVGREFADAQIYVALRRLEEHGIIEARDEIPVPSKKSRGRPRRYYALTVSGQRALADAGAYNLLTEPFKRSTSRGDDEGTAQEGQMPSPVVV